MYKIIIATDFSKAAMNAAESAMKLAAVLNSEVLLLHAYSVPLSPPESFVIVSSDEIKTIAEQFLRKEMDRLRQIEKLNISFKAVEGDWISAIHEITMDDREYLLITGNKMKKNKIEYVFGDSNTDLMNRLKIPVLMIPEKWEFKKINKMVLALEKSTDFNLSSVDFISKLGLLFPVKLFIVKVLEPNETIMDELSFRSSLLTSKLKHMGLEYVFPRSSNPASELETFVKDQDIDLLVLQSHQHHFIDRLFNRSEARKLVSHSAIPVLLFPSLKSHSVRPAESLHQQHS
jgi:nucleotide-binding universal stress UspA family protein